MIRVLGLGSVAGATAGVLITGGTNATPIVATITAGHGLKDGDRIAITGVTGLTAMNGEWTLKFVTATTVQLLGSVGNGAFGGTAAVSVICDTTPFMKGHSAAVMVNSAPVGVATAAVLTLIVEGSADNVTFATALLSGQEAIAAQTADQSQVREVVLQKYMRLRCSAYTSGSANAQLMA